MFELKPDFEDVMNRFEAWWECEIIDRPVVQITFPRPRLPDRDRAERKLPKDHRTNPEVFAKLQTEFLESQIHYGDALPVAYGHMGPETIPAFYGCPVEYEGITAWSEPILPSLDPADVAKIQLDENNEHFKRVMAMTDALIEEAKGKYIVGYTIFLGAIDTIAALRDQAGLCFDLLERPEDVKAFADRLTGEILGIYDMFYEKLSALDQPSTTWWNAICRGKFYVPSCDFSCMISGEMFEDVVIPQLLRECRHMDRNIYHLDGERALRHLDRLLEIPEIHAYQWVPTRFGQEGQWREWIDVYQRIQKAGKGFVAPVSPGDIDEFFEVLRPQGAWLWVTGVKNQDEADAVLKAAERWR